MFDSFSHLLFIFFDLAPGTKTKKLKTKKLQVLLQQEEEEKKSRVRVSDRSSSSSFSPSLPLPRPPPPIVLLDDPLSALDSAVAACVVERALASGRRSVLRSSTRVVATHSPLVLGRSDVVIRLSMGRGVSVGPPTAAERARAEAAAEAARRSSRAAAAAAAVSGSAPGSAAASPASSCSSLAGGGGSSQGPRSAAAAALEASVAAEAAVGVKRPDSGGDSSSDGAEQEESRSVGAVAWPVYRRYLRAAGPWMVFLAAASLLLMQATRNGADVWLAAWVSSEDASEARAAAKESESASSSSPSPSSSPSSSSLSSSLNEMPESTRFYLAGLVVIAAANSVFALARAFSYALACLSACRRLHDQALAGVLAAPLSFYSNQPAGRLLNRFSADVAVADDDLPVVANVALA